MGQHNKSKKNNGGRKRSFAFSNYGFSRPIEAEPDTVAVGGTRQAIFARGLFFTETVTQIEPFKILAFNIKADPKSIPPKALAEHVMVGGKYFNVLEGRYEIENVTANKILLHLTSQFRLSTPFNFYSGLWSKIIMKDIGLGRISAQPLLALVSTLNSLLSPPQPAGCVPPPSLLSAV